MDVLLDPSLFNLLFLLIAVHALADFVLQHEAMVKGKNRHHPIHSNADIDYPAWYYWLFSHALIHGLGVLLVTGHLLLAIAETVLHGLIDFCKCERFFNLHIDQLLHLLCKLGYVIYLVAFY